MKLTSFWVSGFLWSRWTSLLAIHAARTSSFCRFQTLAAFNPEFCDPNWPGSKPANGTFHAMTINIQFDDSPEELQWRLEQFVGNNNSTTGAAAENATVGTAISRSIRVNQAQQDEWSVVQDFVGTIDLAGLLFNYTIEDLLPDTRYRFVISESGHDSSRWATLTTEKGRLWSLEGGQLKTGLRMVELFVEVNGTVGLATVPLTVELFGKSYSISETTSISQPAFGHLTRTMPTELGMMTSLTSLVLFSNQLTSTIPTELGMMTSLNFLELCNNQLSGVIPTELGRLTGLTWLSIRGNRLTGVIPTELGMLTCLAELSLCRNQLTGVVPSELGLLTALRDLDLNGNLLINNNNRDSAIEDL